MVRRCALLASTPPLLSSLPRTASRVSVLPLCRTVPPRLETSCAQVERASRQQLTGVVAQLPDLKTGIARDPEFAPAIIQVAAADVEPVRAQVSALVVQAACARRSI